MSDLLEQAFPTILIVDDVDTNIEILEEILKTDYNILSANNGKEALQVLENAEILPRIILMDVMMPVMGGKELFHILKQNGKYKNIPIIFITAEDDSESELLTAGAVDFIRKPFTPEVVKLRVNNQIDLRAYRENMERLVLEKTQEVIKKTEEAKNILDGVLQGLANTIEHRDMESGEHVKRTQLYVEALVSHLIESKSVYAAELLDMDPEIIVKSMALHDVGKIAIPDRVLLKPGRLDPEEYEVMKTHTTRGRLIINELGDTETSLYLMHCKNICYCHHERWDGRGYPRGIKDYSIPIVARLAAVADVYDALICARVYKPVILHSDAIKIMTEGRGTQFDPIMIDALEHIQDVYIKIAMHYK